jgi:cardiolipin synthase
MHFVPELNKLYLDLKDEWEARLASIHHARRFLYIATYYIDYDEYGIAFFDALKKAAKRGVRIYLLVDSFALKLAKNMASKEQCLRLEQAFEEIRKHHINLHIYRPKRLSKRLLGYGMHVKFQISDSAEVFMSSGNITAHSYELWKDISLYVHGPTAGLILDACREYFPETIVHEDIEYLMKCTKEHNAINYEIYHHNPNSACTLLNIFNDDYKNPITDRLAKLIDASRKSLLLGSLYFKPNRQILNAIIKAAFRGVKISILHSHISSLGCSEYPYFPCISPLRELLKFDNVRIYEDIQGHHSKYLLSDNNILMIGSYNFEHAAHDRVSECMLETKDACLIQQISSYFDGELQKSTILQIDLNYLDMIAKHVRWRYWFSRPLHRLV